MHPNDPKAKAKFQALSEAYDVIGDPEKRKNMTNMENNGAMQRPLRMPKEADLEEVRLLKDLTLAVLAVGRIQFFLPRFVWTGSPFKFTGGFNAERNSGEMNANVNIDLYTALLGGEVIIQLSSGQKLKLKIKPGTQPGTKARLRGKGYDRGDGSFGDLIITYNVKLPTSLSEKQKELLQQMRNS